MAIPASTAARRGPDTVEILQLRVDLEHVAPKVYRTILIRATSPLSTLHTVIQCVMGWEDSHLHEFSKDGVRYGPTGLLDDLDDMGWESERKQLGTLFRTGDKTLSYLYDFGDSWYHTVTLEARLPPDLTLQHPQCVLGENACPPEDVGGPPGYMDYLEAVLDPQHEEHAEMLAWRGPDFHPSKFDIEKVQAKLKRVFSR